MHRAQELQVELQREHSLLGEGTYGRWTQRLLESVLSIARILVSILCGILCLSLFVFAYPDDVGAGIFVTLGLLFGGFGLSTRLAASEWIPSCTWKEKRIFVYS